jgi:VanZ family protein
MGIKKKALGCRLQAVGFREREKGKMAKRGNGLYRTGRNGEMAKRGNGEAEQNARILFPGFPFRLFALSPFRPFRSSISPRSDMSRARHTGLSLWLWLWGPVIAYCALIFFGSAQQDLTPPKFLSSDKVAHFLEYGVLGLLWARAAKTTRPHWTFPVLLVSATLFTGFYALTDETHQLYVPGRVSDWRDAVADVCGGTIGGLLYLLSVRLQARKTVPSPTPAL